MKRINDVLVKETAKYRQGYKNGLLNAAQIIAEETKNIKQDSFNVLLNICNRIKIELNKYE